MGTDCEDKFSGRGDTGEGVAGAAGADFGKDGKRMRELAGGKVR